ncbi:MAG TPA: ethylbenzene dehydrogenase-related protein [Puia sp.]|nr:ethylbenzene dehydrogenase-related protein [Puia sp.]
MKKLIVVVFVFLPAFLLLYCTKKDQIVGVATTSQNQLVAVRTSTSPVIDGNLDAVWANAPQLHVSPQVPSPGNGTFAGYIGNTFNVTLRSMYTADSIYFLAQWDDPTKSLVNQPVAFNPSTKLWARQSNNYAFDNNGNYTTIPFNEDKFGFQWNIDHSIALFASQSCYATCHLNPATDSINNHVTPPQVVTIPARAGGNHFTNGPQEKADLWHIHLMQDQAYGFADDDYIDYAGGQLNANGRHSDGATVQSITNGIPTYNAVPGSVTNTQTLKIGGTGASVTVPAWVVKGQTNAYYLLTSSVTAGAGITTLTNVTAADGTAALLVIGVDANGVLTLSDSSTIDPGATADYSVVTNDKGSITGVGPKAIPGLVLQKYQGGRANIRFKAVYSGSGWTLELVRALKTADHSVLQDVDFSPLTDVDFGIAVFDQANTAHAIMPGLTLHFQQ